MLLYLQGIFLCKKCTKNLDVSKNISTFALAKAKTRVTRSTAARLRYVLPYALPTACYAHIGDPGKIKFNGWRQPF